MTAADTSAPPANAVRERLSIRGKTLVMFDDGQVYQQSQPGALGSMWDRDQVVDRALDKVLTWLSTSAEARNEAEDPVSSLLQIDAVAILQQVMAEMDYATPMSVTPSPTPSTMPPPAAATPSARVSLTGRLDRLAVRWRAHDQWHNLLREHRQALAAAAQAQSDMQAAIRSAVSMPQTDVPRILRGAINCIVQPVSPSEDVVIRVTCRPASDGGWTVAIRCWGAFARPAWVLLRDERRPVGLKRGSLRDPAVLEKLRRCLIAELYVAAFMVFVLLPEGSSLQWEAQHALPSQSEASAGPAIFSKATIRAADFNEHSLALRGAIEGGLGTAPEWLHWSAETSQGAQG